MRHSLISPLLSVKPETPTSQESPMYLASRTSVPTDPPSRSLVRSSLRKLVCCALLALPASEAFSAVSANPSLSVNITCNISAIVRIEWTNGTGVDTGRVWALANVDLNTPILSGGNVADALIPGTPIVAGLHVTNRSQVPVDLAIGVSAQAGWVHAPIAGHTSASNDIYTIRASTNAVPAADTLNAGTGQIATAGTFTIALPASPTTISFSDELVKDANQILDLEFITPFNVLTNSATMTVTITGSVD